MNKTATLLPLGHRVVDGRAFSQKLPMSFTRIQSAFPDVVACADTLHEAMLGSGLARIGTLSESDGNLASLPQRPLFSWQQWGYDSIAVGA